jgi:hypothetical protein
MVMALKRRNIKINEKVKIIQEVEMNPTVLQNELAKCSVLPPSSLRNIISMESSTS